MNSVMLYRITRKYIDSQEPQSIDELRELKSIVIDIVEDVFEDEAYETMKLTEEVQQ